MNRLVNISISCLCILITSCNSGNTEFANAKKPINNSKINAITQQDLNNKETPQVTNITPAPNSEINRDTKSFIITYNVEMNDYSLAYYTYFKQISTGKRYRFASCTLIENSYSYKCELPTSLELIPGEKYSLMLDGVISKDSIIMPTTEFNYQMAKLPTPSIKELNPTPESTIPIQGAYFDMTFSEEMNQYSLENIYLTKSIDSGCKLNNTATEKLYMEKCTSQEGFKYHCSLPSSTTLSPNAQYCLVFESSVLSEAGASITPIAFHYLSAKRSILDGTPGKYNMIAKSGEYLFTYYSGKDLAPVAVGLAKPLQTVETKAQDPNLSLGYKTIQYYVNSNNYSMLADNNLGNKTAYSFNGNSFTPIAQGSLFGFGPKSSSPSWLKIGSKNECHVPGYQTIDYCVQIVSSTNNTSLLPFRNNDNFNYFNSTVLADGSIKLFITSIVNPYEDWLTLYQINTNNQATNLNYSSNLPGGMIKGKNGEFLISTGYFNPPVQIGIYSKSYVNNPSLPSGFSLAISNQVNPALAYLDSLDVDQNNLYVIGTWGGSNAVLRFNFQDKSWHKVDTGNLVTDNDIWSSIFIDPDTGILYLGVLSKTAPGVLGAKLIQIIDPEV